jgi:hypothetical protein
LRSTSNMAWLMPFSLAIWNWLFTAAKSATSYLRHGQHPPVPL